MDFSLEQGLSLLNTLLINFLLIIGLGTALSVVQQKSEQATVTESMLPNQNINSSVYGTDAPTLNLKTNIKIKNTNFNGTTTLEEKLAVIKEHSNCSARDYDGNVIPYDNIKIKLDNDDSATLDNYIRNGGIIKVKYFVEDSKGRKKAVIKNVIIQKH